VTRDDAGARVLGAIIAGGASRRFGSPKAFARVGGERVIDRVANALRTCVAPDDIVAIVNDDELAKRTGLPHRSDAITGMGALGGLHAALTWAHERRRVGVIAVGCDMPFLSPGLLSEILVRRTDNDVVIPTSDGPRGVEPLCAFYATTCIAAIDDALARDDARMIGFHDSVKVDRIPGDVVRTFGDPAVMFMNLDSEADRLSAEQIMGSHS
jgi:molybdopterin-guanine dinucleotide biosynthesis protein A